MLRKILFSFLFVLILLISITLVFRYFVNVCDDYLLPENGVFRENVVEDAKNKTIDYLFAVEPENSGNFPEKAEYSAVIGRLKTENQYYYTIYNRNGSIAGKGKLPYPADECNIHDIRTTENKISILCEENGNGTLFEINISGNSSDSEAEISKICTFSTGLRNGKFLKMILPDTSGSFFLVAGTHCAALYNRAGDLIRMYEYDGQKSIVTSAVLTDDEVLYICGAMSSSEDGQVFSNGFAEAFDMYGKSMWVKQFLSDMNYISAVMECQISSGNLAVYGRYFDYSKSEVIMTILNNKRFEEFTIYGHGVDYYIYTTDPGHEDGAAVQASLFMSVLDKDGSEMEMTVYSSLNDFRVPSLSQEGSLNKLNAKGEFMLTSAHSKVVPGSEYYLTIDGRTLSVPGNISVLYDMDNSSGIYVYLAESANGVYKMKYFPSIDDFSSGLDELKKALRVSSVLDKIPDVLPWFFIATVGIIFLKAKNSWRVIY